MRKKSRREIGAVALDEDVFAANNIEGFVQQQREREERKRGRESDSKKRNQYET